MASPAYRCVSRSEQVEPVVPLCDIINPYYIHQWSQWSLCAVRSEPEEQSANLWLQQMFNASLSEDMGWDSEGLVETLQNSEC